MKCQGGSTRGTILGQLQVKETEGAEMVPEIDVGNAGQGGFIQTFNNVCSSLDSTPHLIYYARMLCCRIKLSTTYPAPARGECSEQTHRQSWVNIAPASAMHVGFAVAVSAGLQTTV
jgi:hypothetical protein